MALAGGVTLDRPPLGQAPLGDRPLAARVDRQVLATDILAAATRYGGVDISAARQAVDRVKEQDFALGHGVEAALLAQFTPVQQGEYAAARSASGRLGVPPSAGALQARAETGRPSSVQALAERGNVAAAAKFLKANPDQIEAVVNAFAKTRPSLVPSLLAASGADVAARVAAAANRPTLENRVWGGLRAIGGGVEAVVGGALVLAPEPTTLTKIGGGVLAAHGADNFVAGFRQAWTGLPAESQTQQAAEAVARQLGADPETASRIGVGVDIGVGLLGSGLASLGRVAANSRLVWAGIKATQPVYAGTVVPRSFELTAGATKVWVHGNGSKHIADHATALLARGVSPNLVNVGSQVQLASLQAAVAAAGKQGIVYEKLVNVGGWDLIFSAPRAAGLLPVLKHALAR